MNLFNEVADALYKAASKTEDAAAEYHLSQVLLPFIKQEWHVEYDRRKEGERATNH